MIKPGQNLLRIKDQDQKMAPPSRSYTMNDKYIGVNKGVQE